MNNLIRFKGKTWKPMAKKIELENEIKTKKWFYTCSITYTSNMGVGQ
jgi:hypothetical protein